MPKCVYNYIPKAYNNYQKSVHTINEEINVYLYTRASQIIIVGYKMSGSDVALVHWEKAGKEDEDRIRFISDSNSDCSSDSDDEINARAPEKQNNIRAPCFSYVVFVFSMITMSLYGYETIVISGALLELESDFSLDRTRKELLVSAALVAATFGAVFGGALNEKLGRKKTIMIAAILFATGDTLSAGAPPVEWGWSIVLAGRFISGLGIGKCNDVGILMVCVCACVRTCVRTCVRACVCACMRVCVCISK